MTDDAELTARPAMPTHHKYILRLYWWLSLTYVLCFFPLFSTFQVAETLLVVLFFWVLFARRDLRLVLINDPFFKILLTLLIYLLGSIVWHKFSLPEGMETNFRFNRYYMKPFMILAIALSIAMGSTRRSWTLLIAALSGMILYLALFTTASDWANAWNGARTDFGIHNAQHTGMLFGSCLLALLFFAPRSIMAIKKRLRPVIAIIMLALILLALFGTLVSQTRAVWLGLFAAFNGTGLLTLYVCRRNQINLFSGKNALRWMVGTLGLAIVLTFSLASFDASDIVENRLATETITIQKLEEAGSLEKSPTTSISIRVASWSAALTWFSERPWLGWGGGTTDDLIDRSDFFSALFKNKFGHLHNSYMETLVSHGAIGALLMLSLVIWLVISTFSALYQGRMPLDVFLFAGAFFVYWMVVNIFESYILYASGQYSNAVIGGFIYSFYLRGKIHD